MVRRVFILSNPVLFNLFFFLLERKITIRIIKDLYTKTCLINWRKLWDKEVDISDKFNFISPW